MLTIYVNKGSAWGVLDVPINNSKAHTPTPSLSSTIIPDNTVVQSTLSHPQSTTSSSHFAATGIENFEKSCYLNSVLQCLTGTPGFIHYFLEKTYENDLTLHRKSKLPCLTLEFAKMAANMWSGNFSAIKCDKIKVSCISTGVNRKLRLIILQKLAGEVDMEWGKNTEQDAHEFLSFFLNRVHDETKSDRNLNDNCSSDKLPPAAGAQWKKANKENTSIIRQFFLGQTRTCLECGTCLETSSTYAVFIDIALPVPTVVNRPTTIEDCVSAFFASETLTGPDSIWHDAPCSPITGTTKDLVITRPPPVLITYLKRFLADGAKLTTPVEISLELDIKNYIFLPTVPVEGRTGDKVEDTTLSESGSSVYDLYALCNHKGTSLLSGHYTAQVKNILTGKWNHFDDARVTPIAIPEKLEVTLIPG